MVTVSNSTVSANRGGSGGGIYNRDGTLSVSYSTFANNSAFDRYFGGGGIANSDRGTVTVSNSIVSGNSTTGYGGGIYNAGALALSSSIVSDNRADQCGGGIFNRGALTVNRSTFSDNTATDGYGGGGIYNFGTLNVSHSTFADNRATHSGGGIYNTATTLTVSNSTLSNSTFAGNRATVGGGIYNGGYEGTLLIVSNSTFADNDASWQGGGIYTSSFSGPVTLKNTVVADSPTGGNCSGPIIDGGGNLSYPDTTCSGINGDPKLGPLQDNGGPTWTMALLPGSAAINAGDDAICAAPPINNLDQRGVARPQGAHCDIGAYEAKPPPIFLPIILR
jgi:predicted outer membrane repeat protein